MKTEYTFNDLFIRNGLSKITTIGLFIFLISSFLIGCDDIFEKGLSKDKVDLVAPGDNVKTEISTQTFYWKEKKGASSYNLQVVTPSFNGIEQFIADTTVIGYRFTMNLTPGTYQWRVFAKNGASKSDSSYTWTLTIDSTMDLSRQHVELNAPANEFITNLRNITFEWKKMYNANGYIFQITDMNGTPKVDTSTTSFSAVKGSILLDGTYNWGVKAFNDNTSTNFTTRKITIDRTPPSTAPMLATPTDKEQKNQWPVNLTWNRSDTDGGSNLYDSIFVAIDTFFTNKVTYYKSGTKNQAITLSDDTTYFWKVRTIDAAGNHSPFSAIRKFKKIH